MQLKAKVMIDKKAFENVANKISVFYRSQKAAEINKTAKSIVQYKIGNLKASGRVNVDYTKGKVEVIYGDGGQYKDLLGYAIYQHEKALYHLPGQRSFAYEGRALRRTNMSAYPNRAWKRGNDIDRDYSYGIRYKHELGAVREKRNYLWQAVLKHKIG